MAFGAFVRLDGPVEGLIHISELSNRRIQHPKDVVKEGDVVPVKLVRIEKDRHRLGLSLRQARNDAEAMGFQFDANGAVIDYPDDVREQFQLPPRDASVPVRRQPKTAQEAIEQAVSRDPEPISAFAHAFAQALENAEAGSVVAATVVDASVEAPAEADAEAAGVVEAAAATALVEDAAAEAPVGTPLAEAGEQETVAESSDAGEAVAETQDSSEATAAATDAENGATDGSPAEAAAPSEGEESADGS